jgi:hypothetical protein
MAAAQYQLKKRAVVAVTLKDKLVLLMMSNYAAAYSVRIQERERKGKKKSEHQSKLHVDGKSGTKSELQNRFSVVMFYTLLFISIDVL